MPDTVSLFNVSRGSGRQSGIRPLLHISDGSSLRRAWNTTQRRYGLVPDRTTSYPLLAVRKTVPTVAGLRRVTSDAPGVSSGGGGGVRQKLTTPARYLFNLQSSLHL